MTGAVYPVLDLDKEIRMLSSRNSNFVPTERNILGPVLKLLYIDNSI